MPKQRSFSDKLWLVFKGLAMGAANKVPGVSGGMVAFVAGFYEEFIYSLQKINRKALLLLRAGKFRILWAYINGRFLSLLILGMVISYFSVSKLLDYFLVHFELYVWSLFFGMIVGSIYYVAKDFGQWNRTYLLYLLFGVMVGVGISFLEPAKQNDHLFFVFLCGMIGVSGMNPSRPFRIIYTNNPWELCVAFGGFGECFVRYVSRNIPGGFQFYAGCDTNSITKSISSFLTGFTSRFGHAIALF